MTIVHLIGKLSIVAVQVYVIGETGILEELDLKGIEHLGGPEDAAKEVALKKGEYMEHDSDVSAGSRGSYASFHGGWSGSRYS